MVKTVSITIQAGNPRFQPNPLMQGGDLAFWINKDPNAAHWPAPVGQADDAWIPFQIPQAVAGQDPSTSDAVTFDGDGEYDYRCVLHAHETGKVIVGGKGAH